MSYTTLEVDSHDLALVSFEVSGTQLPNTFNTRALIDAYSIGLTPIAGAQVRAYDKLWLGASYELFGLPLFGGGDFLQTTDASFIEAGSQVATRVRAIIHGLPLRRINASTSWPAVEHGRVPTDTWAYQRVRGSRPLHAVIAAPVPRHARCSVLTCRREVDGEKACHLLRRSECLNNGGVTWVGRTGSGGT